LNEANPGPVREEGPGAGVWATGLGQDVRFAMRWLRRDWGFAAAAILTLAFGIGATTAIFTVVDHVALRGLPYAEPARLVTVEQTRPDQPEVEPWASMDNLLAVRARSKMLERVAGISPVWSVVMSGEGEAERLEALFVSPDFFRMLGVRPVVGRLFTPDEDDRMRPAAVAVLSDGLWRRRFGASPDVVGRVVRLDGHAVTIVGVLPGEFRWLGEPLAGTGTAPELWLPLAANPMAMTPRMVRFLKIAGQLRPGVTAEQAGLEMQQIRGALAVEFADERLFRLGVTPLEERTHGRLRPAAYLLLATAGVVLLLAAANAGSLLLAKAASRGRELAVRMALGASTGRLLRQLLTESLVLAALGGGAGLGVAAVLLRLLVAYGPEEMMRRADIAMDGRAVAFTAMVVLASAVMAGMTPAWRAVAGLAGAARDGRGVSARNRMVRRALAAVQIAMALVLLAGSGLMVRSLLSVLAVDPGFEARGVVSISTQTPAGAGGEVRTEAYNRIRAALLAAPGVESVGCVSRLPLLGQNLGSQIHVEGREAERDAPEVEFRAATASYFRAMRIPLVAGRLFEDRDKAQGRELVVDAVTVARHFPRENPVGKRLRLGPDGSSPWWTIVGVVGATRHFGLDAAPRPTVYRHVSTNPLNSPILVIRTSGDPEAMAPGLSRLVRSAYGGMPAYNVFSMEQLVARSTAQRRFLMWLTTGFAGIAMVLAGIGVYGAMAQSVALRRKEMGIRVALGAPAGSVVRLVLAEGLGIAGWGVVVGLGVSVAGAWLGRALLFGVAPYDPVVYAGAVIVVTGAAMAACWGPARRAGRLDPVVTLRES